MTSSEIIKILKRRRTISIFAAYYYDGKTQREIATKYGISRVRVTQIITEGIEKLVQAGLPAPKRKSSGRVYCYGDALDRLTTHVRVS